MDSFILDSGLYIDDDNLVFFILPLGARWNREQKKMVIEDDKIEEDRTESGDRRTMREMVQMACSVCPILQFTEDCPGKHDDQKMPLLDLKVWVEKEEEEQKILFKYYRKPMASRLLMMARSAMPSRVKRASLTQEGLRMMRNTSLETPLGGEGDHADRPLSQDEDVGILREIQTQHHRVHLAS